MRKKDLVDPVLALEYIIECWQYMAETGDFSKDAMMKKMKLEDGKILCGACEFDFQNKRERKCIACREVINWSRKKYCICEDDGTPYSAWLEAETLSEHKRASRRMVKLMSKSLDKLLVKLLK